MNHRTIIAASVLAGLVLVPSASRAQLPAGTLGAMSLPTGGLSTDTLLKQAQTVVADLIAMKSSGSLAPAQAKQVDGLLPKAQSLTGELEKPQVDAARLPQLASNLTGLQKQVAVLKGFMK
jgi:hypothetical protein